MVKDTDAEVHKAREKFITAGAADSQVVDFLTAADGVSTSVPGFAPFFGTSAAAPHAAAIAALQVQKQGCRTPSEILAAQRSSGVAVGAYTTDSIGSGKVTATTAITGLTACPTKPIAPTNVSAVAGKGAATVSWTAPTWPGTAPITGYRVTPYVGAVAQPIQAFASTATTQNVTGLTNGTAYSFVVEATNVNGVGTASAASNVVTPIDVPGAPTGVTGTSSSGMSFVASRTSKLNFSACFSEKS